eukprot:g34555.t1
MVCVWNELPEELVDVSTVTSFKRYLDKYVKRNVLEYRPSADSQFSIHANVLYNLAAVYSRLGQWLEAQQTLEDALRLRAKGTNTELDRALSMVKV